MRNTILVLLISIISHVQAQDLLRTPALSPDGQKIAFSFQGDIWVMNQDGTELNRITIHEAYETHPVWNADGTKLAFTSNRYGNNDVFVTNATGGMPKRLTYSSSDDEAFSWVESSIYFTTYRTFRQVERDPEVYKISETGGTPERALNAVGDQPAVSPDGRFIAIAIGSCRLSREQYRGPADNELWIYDTKDMSYHQLTNNETNDHSPAWGDNRTLYFAGLQNERYNVMKVTINEKGEATGAPSIETAFTEDGLRTLSVGGGKMIMERKNGFTMLADGNVNEMNIAIPTDYRFDPMERETFRGDINEYAVSPNGKWIAMEIRGEIFVKQNDKEKSRSVNVSQHAYRDQSPVWLNDSTLIYSSDRNGQFDLYLVRSSDPNKTDIFTSLKHETIRLTSTPEEEHDPVISHDGKMIAYEQGRGKLITAEIDNNGRMTNAKTLLDGWDSPSGVTWSPDNKWLAYSLADLNFNDEVFIHAADNSKEPVNVSMHPKGDRSPFWSADGKKLGFSTNRNEGSDYDVWFVWLQKEEYQKTELDREEGYYFDEEDQQEDKKDNKKNDNEPSQPIQIDFDRIYDRQVQVTSLPGDEYSFVIDKEGEMFYFVSQTGLDNGSDLFEIKWNGQDIKQLTKGGQSPYGLSFHADKDELYYLTRGTLNSMKGGKSERLPHEATMTIDHAKEREQVFEEAWRALNAGFYDPNFHGRDWNALKAKYKPWVLSASTTQDFRYMYNEMLGQLNASHMGLRGSDPEEVQRERTGRLGIEVKPAIGGVKVVHVVPGTPADRDKSKLEVDDLIVAVNGQPVTQGTNFYSMFNGETDNQVLLTVRRGKNVKEIVIQPSSSISTDLYEEWVMERQKLTEKYSDGRLGYIHIRGMNMPSFERFERELMASGYGKEGIVIDVRWNGGGYTTDYLMAVLNVTQHAYTVPRGATDNLDENHPKFSNYYPGSRLPLASWTKPSVAMCNEASYSNAEIFSHAYKNLGIGKLVGQPTFGAVISTGAQRLMDGSYVRMPFRAWYVKKTGENMEHGPAVPDVLVQNAPDSKAKGEDPQLKKAVEVLLNQLGE